MNGDDHRQPGPILGQIPHLPRPARLADGWHCKQLPNGANPIVVCERADLLADVERLRAEVERKHDYACRMDALAEERLMQATRLRAAGDALAVRYRKTFGLDGMFDAELRQWEAACRE